MSTNLALKENHNQLVKEDVSTSHLVVIPRTPARTKYNRAFIALITLIAFQILDGILTYTGVSIHGNTLEGNPIVYNLIENYGQLFGVTIAKAFTVLAILFLWRLKDKVKWIPKSLEIMGLYYFFFAIVPWGIILTDTLI